MYLFYAVPLSGSQVNTNGAISFITAISAFTPIAFPLAGEFTLIAPYWADVDTRGFGPANNDVWYRNTSDPVLLSRARDEIQLAFLDQHAFSPTLLFIATWDQVGYFERKTNRVSVLMAGKLCENLYIIIRFLVTQLNTFQCILATNGFNTFAIFLYADGMIQWTTGDISGGNGGLGGTPAQVGFNAGDGVRFAIVPESQTNQIVNIDTTSNVDVPGVWIFRLDGVNVTMGGCIVESEGESKLEEVENQHPACMHDSSILQTKY